MLKNDIVEKQANIKDIRPKKTPEILINDETETRANAIGSKTAVTKMENQRLE
ncbi:hypothetical protein [Agrobacterium tumefaciens]|uniref:hypothetical protein n=1 Tax=Agrobacterium tumefaciens TaxID=358 RepID=UPI0015721916|nr:hypothetical protein [Agrobacterium tumefaciens]NTE33399.1 hypothetical protein [Agrobacterium tumefaciens]NTE48909.1 hypothetical protein [Agrobacterium tumefaciens]